MRICVCATSYIGIRELRPMRTNHRSILPAKIKLIRIKENCLAYNVRTSSFYQRLIDLESIVILSHIALNSAD